MRRENKTREQIINLHKTRACNHIVETLLAPSIAQLAEELNKIIQLHHGLTLGQLGGMYYKGNTYGRLAAYRAWRNELHPELHARMDQYLFESSQLNHIDQPRVAKYIAYALSKSGNAATFKLLIPEYFHRYIDGIPELCFTGSLLTLNRESQETLVTNHTETIQLIKGYLIRNLIYA